MRLLVACPNCQRQYDATGRAVGSRFHCYCSEIVTVQPPQGHDAAVVRCSSCGAARQAQAIACPHCGSDFTLHERDLHTVCPACLARVSDRARYCHHCGTGLVPELDAGSPTTLYCPACPEQRELTSRRLGAEGVTLLECGCCTGMWLGLEAFQQLAERVAQAAVSGINPHAKGKPPGPQDRPLPPGPLYRPCTVCGGLMNRRQYGGSSGVIVDACKEHGIWFDADELSRILHWIRVGGLRRKADPLAGLAGKKSQTAAKTSTIGGNSDGWQDTSDNWSDSPLLQSLFAVLSLFRGKI